MIGEKVVFAFIQTMTNLNEANTALYRLRPMSVEMYSVHVILPMYFMKLKSVIFMCNIIKSKTKWVIGTFLFLFSEWH